MWSPLSFDIALCFYLLFYFVSLLASVCVWTDEIHKRTEWECISYTIERTDIKTTSYTQMHYINRTCNDHYFSDQPYLSMATTTTTVNQTIEKNFFWILHFNEYRSFAIDDRMVETNCTKCLNRTASNHQVNQHSLITQTMSIHYDIYFVIFIRVHFRNI
jgi:hypothetical protein